MILKALGSELAAMHVVWPSAVVTTIGESAGIFSNSGAARP